LRTQSKLRVYSVSPPCTDSGFVRTILAGRGHSLKEAFASLRVSPRVSSRCEFPERGLFGARVELDRRDGRGFCEFLEIRDSAYVVTENFEYADALLESVPGDGLLSFHVRLAGKLSIAVSRTTSLQIACPTLLVWHQPTGINASEWWTPGPGLSVTIFCRPEFIRSALNAGDMTGTGHIGRFLCDNTASINYCQLPVTAEILAAAQSILSSPYENRVRLLHMEAKALELYCLILSAFDRLSDAVNEQYSEADQRCLHHAREILSSRFNPVPTIHSIAREVGLNETKLKCGFKTLCGKTVFEYGQLCRMERAMRLLRDQHLPIGLVADAVGYSHQTSFASAFKNHFGYQPKEIRRLPLPGAAASPTGTRNP
jgi:AraC-like DNA-binding protein